MYAAGRSVRARIREFRPLCEGPSVGILDKSSVFDVIFSIR